MGGMYDTDAHEFLFSLRAKEGAEYDGDCPSPVQWSLVTHACSFLPSAGVVGTERNARRVCVPIDRRRSLSYNASSFADMIFIQWFAHMEKHSADLSSEEVFAGRAGGGKRGGRGTGDPSMHHWMALPLLSFLPHS